MCKIVIKTLRDQSLLLPGRGKEVFLLIMKIFHNPSISSLKFSRTPGILAVTFRGPFYIKFYDKFVRNISYFLITSDAKEHRNSFKRKKWFLKIHENIH